jgi:hypothetical protein
MPRVQATAEVFFTAFKALPKKEQEVFLSKLFSDKSTREEMIDLVIYARRRSEPSRSLQACIKERKARYGGKV